MHRRYCWICVAGALIATFALLAALGNRTVKYAWSGTEVCLSAAVNAAAFEPGPVIPFSHVANGEQVES